MRSGAQGKNIVEGLCTVVSLAGATSLQSPATKFIVERGAEVFRSKANH
jgi:hypothetical protein